MTKITSSMLALGFLMMGAKCTSTPTIEKPKTPVAINVYDNVEAINKTTELIQEDAEKIVESTIVIAESTNIIKQSTDDPTITKEADKIAEQNNIIENTAIEIVQGTKETESHISSDQIQPMLDQIENLEKTNDEWKEKYDSLVVASLAETQKLIRIFWAIGFAMIVVGLVVTYFYRLVGGLILCAGFIAVGLASAHQYYQQEIASIGLAVFVLGMVTSIVSVVYFLMKAKNTENAVKDNVKLLEQIKIEIPEETKQKIFGDDGIARNLQTASTKKLVKEIRSKLVK